MTLSLIKNIFIALILIITICACQSKNESKSNFDSQGSNHIEQLNWLIGKWKDASADGDLYEVWAKKNDSVFSGRSFMIANGDTVFSETILLKHTAEGLFYIPTVSNQNDQKPVSFKLISYTNGAFVFENKEHDFPQRIIYKNPNPDSLYASVEGEEDGKLRKEEFRLIKVLE